MLLFKSAVTWYNGEDSTMCFKGNNNNKTGFQLLVWKVIMHCIPLLTEQLK